jgi:hypothetical protein
MSYTYFGALIGVLLATLSCGPRLAFFLFFHGFLVFYIYLNFFEKVLDDRGMEIIYESVYGVS